MSNEDLRIAASSLARLRWDAATDEQRKSVSQALARGRLVAAARKLDPDGTLRLVERAHALFDGGAE
ncbi:MAG: hypothetical protein IT299_00755 [Dehalococcoidia bacterium]|nr:hypothetical protein [Dehalococcoidia bacterium]